MRHFWNETGPALPSGHYAAYDEVGLRLDGAARVKSVFPDDVRVRIEGGELIATEQPAHSLRIVDVRE